MEWFRWFHGAVSDDKWPLIARRSGQSVAVVIAVWAGLLECASQAEIRGSIEDFDPESMDAMLGLEDGACQAVINALSEGKRPRLEHGQIVNWCKRQPSREREDESKSTDRVRKHRERQKHLQDEDLSKCNTNETPVKHNETPLKHHETPRTEKRREEEKREDNINLTPTEKVYIPRAPDELDECECLEQEKDFLPMQAEAQAEAMPSIDFLELRSFYDENGRKEAPLAGFAEYKQLRAAKTWPGISQIFHAVEELKKADSQWKAGFAPGLGKFLREHGWKKSPTARASPPGTNGRKSTSAEIITRNAEISRQILEAENGKFV